MKLLVVLTVIAVLVLCVYLGIRMAHNHLPILNEFSEVVGNPEKYAASGSYLTFIHGVVVATRMTAGRCSLNIMPDSYIWRDEEPLKAEVITVVIDVLSDRDIPAKVGDFVEVRGRVKRAAQGGEARYFINAFSVISDMHIELSNPDFARIVQAVKRMKAS